MKRALLVIDLQNDYFKGGKFPLWNAEGVLENNLRAVGLARATGTAVILIQHLAAGGKAPFFNEGTEGADIHSALLAAAPDAPRIIKRHADCFHQTELESLLISLGVEEVLLAGMMTQNCVTHTALSKTAERFRVGVIGDCCTTVSEILHLIALRALSPRVPIVSVAEAFAGS